MTHERFRKFNTRETYPNQSIDNDLCQTVKARGTMLFLRGQVGQDIDTFDSVGDGDPVAQTNQAMKNVMQLLSEAGGKMEHICRMQVFLTDRAYRDPVYQTIGKWLKGVYPVSTGLIVDGLARPEWVMEIEITAMIPDDE